MECSSICKNSNYLANFWKLCNFRKKLKMSSFFLLENHFPKSLCFYHFPSFPTKKSQYFFKCPILKGNIFEKFNE